MAKSILVIEDNQQFLNGAKYFFSKMEEVKVNYAKDYDEAIEFLETMPKPDGIISDCFFPKKTGSSDVSLGMKAIKMLEHSDQTEQRMQETEKAFGNLVNLDDNLKRMLRGHARATMRNRCEEWPIFNATKAVSELSGKDTATKALNEVLQLLTSSGFTEHVEYYREMKEALRRSEANQPLGILIGIGAKELGIPFVLTTSTYHHDILTQPIKDYASSNGWKLIDCRPGKEDDKRLPEFWQNAMEAIKTKGKSRT